MRDVARQSFPGSWPEALAALPLHTPPEHGWERLAATLQVEQAGGLHRRRVRHRAWMAAAACACALLASPYLRDALEAPSHRDPPAKVAEHSASPPRAMDRRTDAPAAGTGEPPQSPALAASPVALEAAPALTGNQRVATQEANAGQARPRPWPRRDRLEPLYMASARMEAVLAQLPQAEVADLATLSLQAALDDELQLIDASLSAPGIPESLREQLWNARVDTLQQMAGARVGNHWQLAPVVEGAAEVY